uniref:Myb/SANT-like DNA-binding domain-containing protein n=1 Tax=Strix occidentalis caurina TaxID=311401 RepID=A0A8D0FSR2_STROC
MELESCLRNQHVFNRIAEVLREKGIHRTGDQCREKIKKMKLEYRRIKDNSKAPRGGRTWKFYEVMDRVLTSRPALAYGSLGGSMMAQQVLQGSMVESYHHQFGEPFTFQHKGSARFPRKRDFFFWCRDRHLVFTLTFGSLFFHVPKSFKVEGWYLHS